MPDHIKITQKHGQNMIDFPETPAAKYVICFSEEKIVLHQNTYKNKWYSAV